MTISPELLAAYADGELDDETTRKVEATIARDPGLQANLVAHHALRARLVAHFAPIAEQPVPDRLLQAITKNGDERPNVIDFAARARNRRTPVIRARWARMAGPALAASLILILIVFGLQPADSPYAQGDIARALDSQLASTQKTGARVRILLSFQDRQGQYCRGFTTEGRAGIACRDAGGWRLLKTFDGRKADDTEYRQAGSPDMAVMTVIQRMAAGEALDASEEEQAAHNDWRALRQH